MSSTELRPLPNWLAIVLVVGTSAAILVLEILAGRLLAPYVGVSLDTYTGIIGTVLAGIAVGAWLGGVAADRVDPRVMIPILLVLGGALAIATIPTVRAFGPAGSSTGIGGILFVTAVGFLPSAMVLGAVPPAVVKLQLRTLETTGATVGRLSAYGTAGAIAATFLTGFVLVAVAAVTTLIVGVGVLLVLSGLTLWVCSARERRAASTGTIAGVSAFAGVALAGAALIGSPCDTQTKYYCVTVVDDDDRAGGRTLVLDDLRHSYAVAGDPTHLEFWYTRRFAEVIDLVASSAARPLDVIHIGGGAMTVPSWLQATRPGSRQVVFEIDGELADLVIDEFDRAVGPGTELDVVTGDARLSMSERPDASADVITGDAFGGRAVPWHLATTEFVDDIARVLRPAGVYVLNVIDGPAQDFLAAEARTLGRTFDHVAIVLGRSAADGRRGNSVIVASNTPLGSFDADGGRLVEDIGAFVDGAPVLTDDFAPVDQLLAHSR